jgi:hypothetical protein
VDFSEIRRAARDQGFTEEPPEVGINFVPPDPGRAIVNGRPTAKGRELRNLLHQLRRNGLRWPPGDTG